MLTLDGMPIIERIIRATTRSQLEEVILVYREDEIKKIAEKYGVKAIYNDNAEIGQSESIKLGVHAANESAKGYMFLVGDQPFLEEKTINHLIEAFHKNKHGIIVPLYNKEKGNPVIFSSKFRDKLLQTSGDTGGKNIIKEMQSNVDFISIDNSIVGQDVDTWEAYEKIQNGDETLC